jgi:hypothetical protein
LGTATGGRGVAQFILSSFFFILYSLIVEITETVGLKNREERIENRE